MKHVTIALALAALASAALPLSTGVRAAGKPLAVIVGASSPSKAIDLAILRRAFEGQPTDLDGKRLIPINHATGTPARTDFDRKVLGLEPGDVGKYWIDKRIRDEGAPPKTVPTAELAVRITASVPGAITYVPVELVNASVRVLAVGGKTPGQPGYPLEM